MPNVILAECRYAECRYAECQYSECRGAFLTHVMNLILKATGKFI
jgi:hypothetical protein